MFVVLSLTLVAMMTFLLVRVSKLNLRICCDSLYCFVRVFKDFSASCRRWPLKVFHEKFLNVGEKDSTLMGF